MATATKKTPNGHAIESVRFFPAIAWGIFCLFAAFVYLLTVELKESTKELEAATFNTVSALNNSVTPPVAE